MYHGHMRTLTAFLMLSSMAIAIEPPPGAVVIPIDLAKPVIRVVADCEHSPPEHVLSDIGLAKS